MTHALKRVTSLKYKVYEIQNGLLIEPQTAYGSDRYDWYYDTMEEAVNAVDENNDGDMVILPVAVTSWE